MKLKLKRMKHEWFMGIYMGRGGVSSCVHSRIGSLMHCLKGFQFKYIKKTFKWQKHF